MSLYLAEFMVDLSTKEKRTAIFDNFAEVVKNGGTPNARLIGGPWASLEKQSFFAVVDIPDMKQIMGETFGFVIAGLLVEQRLRPIASWEDTVTLAKEVDG